MRLLRALALLAAPDLHQIAKRLLEVERGLDVAWGLLNDSRSADGRKWLALQFEARDVIAESRARLVEIHADLTGRSMGSDLEALERSRHNPG